MESLILLKDLGTMGHVAARQRLTQSAISKRIRTLEAWAKVRLVEADGRRVRLTAAGESLVQTARPLLGSLRSLGATVPDDTTLIMGVSESLLASTVPGRLKRIQKKLPQLRFELHAHRSLVAVEHVRSGAYLLALCAEPATGKDLRSERVTDEPLVIVPSGLKPLRWRKGTPLPVWTIEPNSATGLELARRLPRLRSPMGLTVTSTLESFAAVVQMAKAGFGHGLVPLGLARAMGVPERRLRRVPGLTRQISLVGRPSVLARSPVQAFLAALRAECDDGDR